MKRLLHLSVKVNESNVNIERMHKMEFFLLQLQQNDFFVHLALF